MNKNILNTNIQEFIDKKINVNTSDILLKGTSFPLVSTSEIVEQIEAKIRCKKKLSTWFNTKNIVYPNKLNIEQTSSEATANYKASLIKGKTIIDLTGGFGVDCYYFSKYFEQVTHCEINNKLSNIVKHNFKQLKTSVNTLNVDGIEYLTTNTTNFDWIYIDPSRRHDAKGKVFFLKDCLPNVPEHLDLLFSHSKNILIKTSPLLDITSGYNELKDVKSIHIIALNNEVKELLWHLEKDYTGDITINTVNIKADSSDNFSYVYNNNNTKTHYSLPLTYLYEPNSAILKSGGFNELAHQLCIDKIHQHSHLYTSNNLIDFPGRRFEIETTIPYNKKEFKKLKLNKANVTTRNFPETVQQIRKKLSIKDGGDIYLFFTTNLNNNKIILVTKKN